VGKRCWRFRIFFAMETPCLSSSSSSLHGVVTLLGFCRRSGVHYRLLSTCVGSFTCPGIDAQVQGTTVFSLIQQTLFVFSTKLGTHQAFQLHGDLYTLYFFSLFWGRVFFTFQHNLGTFCRGELLKWDWISVAKIWSRSLILLFPQENHTFVISCINLCHLGAELSILRCRKRFRGSSTPKKKFFLLLIWGLFGANLGTSCIPYTV
jgi:hypothetical protein